jgi:hypothetical protein
MGKKMLLKGENRGRKVYSGILIYEHQFVRVKYTHQQLVAFRPQ